MNPADLQFFSVDVFVLSFLHRLLHNKVFYANASDVTRSWKPRRSARAKERSRVTSSVNNGEAIKDVCEIIAKSIRVGVKRGMKFERITGAIEEEKEMPKSMTHPFVVENGDLFSSIGSFVTTDALADDELQDCVAAVALTTF